MERDPLGKDAKEPGSKLDAGKSPIYRGVVKYFPRAVAAVALVSEYGANKYTWHGWEQVPDGINRYSDALSRHLFQESASGPNDADTGMLHAAHAAWNALARLELMLRDAESVTGIRSVLPQEDSLQEGATRAQSSQAITR